MNIIILGNERVFLCVNSKIFVVVFFKTVWNFFGGSYARYGTLYTLAGTAGSVMHSMYSI